MYILLIVRVVFTYLSILVFEKNDQDDEKITGGNWKKKFDENFSDKIFHTTIKVNININ